MKVYPQPITKREELNLRQGIKSSLPEIQELFSITFALYLANDEPDVLPYSVTNENGIVIENQALTKLLAFFSEELQQNDKQKFINVINQTPLFTAQMEALQVTLELFWKLAQVKFTNASFPSSQERTGGTRYAKILHYSSNAIIAKLVLANDPSSLKILKQFLFNGIVRANVFEIPLEKINDIQAILTLFSEETQFKIRNNTAEIFFQQEGIYKELIIGNVVSAKDEQEPVGPFRILKSFLKSGLHRFIFEDKNNEISAKKDIKTTDLSKYLNKVATFLALQPRKTTIIQEIGKVNLESNITTNFPPQKILFGCPGTGKSREILSIKNNLQAKEFKTTFHPDSDYSTFVGAYKPVMRGDAVRYEFMPQVFTKAYTYAWNNPTENVLLVIEEINRGNCAQIFGDLFQCLDRNANGASEYAIDAEADLAQYLAQIIENQAIISEFFEANYDGNDCFSKIAFPPNLYIYATMNTSDQSLFPMDSAFKRRWDWQYVPIDYVDAKTLSIKIDEETSYNWSDFITIINRKIYETTQSEDKQLGNRFVNPSDGKTISLEQFRSKVIFYLWSEIYKDEQEKNIFQWKQDADYRLFTFNDLFDKEQFITIIKSFMEYNLVPKNEF